jgi:hypothetical protein
MFHRFSLSNVITQLLKWKRLRLNRVDKTFRSLSICSPSVSWWFFFAAYCSSFSDASPLLRCHRCVSAPETKQIDQNSQNFTSYITYLSVVSGVPHDVLLVAAMFPEPSSTFNFVCFHFKYAFTMKLNLLRNFLCWITINKQFKFSVLAVTLAKK